MRNSRKARKPSIVIGLALVFTLLLALNGSRASSTSTQSIDHVILIMMENHNYAEIIGSPSAPYINSLASNYSLATNYYGIEYPSLPNYIDISSGSNGGITSDCSSGPNPGGCETSDSNIFSLLANNGLTWKSYQESMPSSCYKSDSGNPTTGGYFVHHDPVVYFTDLSSTCSQDDVPLGDVTTQTGAFFTALNGNSLPSFSFITPNSCDDMHNCGVSSGDSWLSEIIPDIINSPSYSSTVTFITWDTGDCQSPCNEYKNGGGQVATIVVGPPTLVGSGNYGAFYNHYSTLAAIESIFGLGNLGRNDASAVPLTSMLNLNGGSTTTRTISTTTSTITNTTTRSSTTSTSANSSTSSSSNNSTTTSFSSSSISNITLTNSTSSSSPRFTSSSTSFNTQQNNTPGTSISSITTGQTSMKSTVTPANVIGSNPTFGFLSALAPARNPPAAFGVGIFEVTMFGALGYILVNLRRVPMRWSLQGEILSAESRELFWRRQARMRRNITRNWANPTLAAVKRFFWKILNKL